MDKATKAVEISNVKVGGGNPLVLIAGPCVIESEESAIFHARAIKDIAASVGMPFIYKSSYDKANRSSLESYRGPGISKGLAILKKVKEQVGISVLSDVHCRSEVEEAAGILDIIQIPAFLCRQTDFVLAVASSGKAINIKKGQFLAPWDILNVIEKVEGAGNDKILLTERGTSFGYNNLVSDMRSLQIMKDFGYPVIYDATHSAQLPGGLGKSSGGECRFVPGLARASVAMGCDGLFIEVHSNPDKALCDGPNMLPLGDLEKLLKQVKAIDRLHKN